jgi:DNA-binding transcriptional MerR regulator
MYGIGTVGRLANVSVRTLRHYDEIGLLRPAEVDARTGYRRYAPEQLHRLHRILALRDLGFPLTEIAQLIDDGVTIEQLRGIIRLRKAEANARLAAQQRQLDRVEARLNQLEGEEMPDLDIIVKSLDPLRAATAAEDLADFRQIDKAAARLYPKLHAALTRHHLPFGGVSYAFYEDLDDEAHPLRLICGLPVPDDITIDEDGVTTIDFPAVERAATTVVRGAPSQFPAAFDALHHWIEQIGEQRSRFEREVYIDCDGPRDTWVTELQTVLVGATSDA